VLIHTARLLQENLREMGTIARLGGDEFILILADFKDYQQISKIAAKLFNVLQKPLRIGTQEIYITSSIGVSIYPNDGETAETLIRNADAAMYKAKEDGRNSFQFYTQDMTERAFERVLMETNLRRALERGEFVVYYQPQYDTRQQRLIGLEALIRWQHPDLGLVAPAKFIPIAEETGLIVPLDRWVMGAVMRQVTAWYQQGFMPGRVALNLAMKQLDQEDFMAAIQNMLNESGCQPQWLAFEITESNIMRNPEKAIAILEQISDLGIEIAVDDFGTGYSSLAYLKRLPVDKLKIDQSFVHDVPRDDEDVAIVKAIIALAKSMKLSVIAEGVEHRQQADFLLQHGCEQIQGYFYSHPQDSGQISQLLTEHWTLHAQA
jgi:predicted signal transduction protein with EAL and GGDEF domain